MDTRTTRNKRMNTDFKWLRNDYFDTDYTDLTVAISLIYKPLSDF